MAAEHIAVVACEDDDGAVCEAAPFERFEDLAYVLVQKRDEPVVACAVGQHIVDVAREDVVPLLVVEVAEALVSPRPTSPLLLTHLVVWREPYFLLRVPVVEWTEVRRVWLERAHAEEKWGLAGAAEELVCLLRDEGALVVLLRYVTGLALGEVGERSFALGRVPALTQKLVVFAPVPVRTRRVIRIVVLSGAPGLLEPALRHSLIPDVPLADIPASVSVLTEDLGRRWDLRREDEVILDAPVRMAERAGQQRRPRWRAHWLCADGVAEESALLG